MHNTYLKLKKKLKNFINTESKNYLPIIIILFIGSLVRLWRISDLPFPPDGDEIAFGYYGWSLLNFGTDEYVNSFPASFISIGDYKYPGLAYMNIIPALFFGLTEITTRFWSALSGVVGIFAIYVFTNYLTNRKSALLTSLFFSLAPWSIIESRLGYENHLAFILTLLGIISLFISFRKISYGNSDRKKNIFTLFAVFLFIVSIFTYAAQRIFIPGFLFIILLSSYIDKEFRENRKNLLLLFILFSFLVSVLTYNSNLRGRADEELWRFGDEQLQEMQLTYHAAGISEVRIHPRITWILHNKYFNYLIQFSDRYLDHFSPKFLFFEGEASDEDIPEMGVLLFIQIFLLPLGAYHILKEQRASTNFIIFGWLLLAPIPSALTHGGAHINRASLMIIPISIISGYGAWVLLRIKGYKGANIMKLALLFAGIWSVLFAMHQIFIVKPYLMPWYKQQVNKEITQKVLDYRDDYKQVVVRDTDYIFYLFYGKISPQEFLSNSHIIPLEDGRWERVKSLYNITFKLPFRCPLSGKLNVLYVCEGLEVPQNAEVIDVVYYWDGVPAYTFIEFYPLSQRPSPLPQLPDKLQYMVDVEKPDGYPDGIIPDNNETYW